MKLKGIDKLSDKILPLGSVVTLKNGDGTELILVARASIVSQDDKEVYYDYGAVVIPQGMVTPEQVFFFNKENVERLIFKGFENAAEQEFVASYDKLLSESPYIKGKL